LATLIYFVKCVLQVAFDQLWDIFSGHLAGSQWIGMNNQTIATIGGRPRLISRLLLRYKDESVRERC